MKDKIIKKILNPTILLICIFGICFYFINTGLMTTDDIVYTSAFNSFSTCIKWICVFYNAWSGRITLTLLIHVFGKLPIIYFKLANAMMFIISILAMYKIITLLIENWNSKIKNLVLIMLFCSIFFINIAVLNSGCLWLAGSFNYLWPLATMLVALIPFISELEEKKIGRAYYVIAIMASFLTGFAEQTSAILIVFGMICILECKIEKRKISKILMVQFLITVIFALINFLAPGNFARSRNEMVLWYPNYEMLSFSDKLVQGYIRLLDHLINDTTILFSVIAILSSYLIISNRNISKASKNISVITIMLIIYILLKLVLSKILIDIFSKIYINARIDKTFFALITFENFDKIALYSKKVLLGLIFSSYIIWSAMIILLCIVIFLLHDNIRSLIISIVMIGTGTASRLVMGFSPTIYASGNRTFTSTDFLLVLVNGLLWAQVFNNLAEKKDKNWKSFIGIKIFFIIIVISSIFCYVNLYKNGISNIIY